MKDVKFTPEKLEQPNIAANGKKMVLDGGYDKGKALEKISFQHDAIIDVMLQRPRIQQKELAEMFGYSCGWMNRLCNTDAFQARIAQRKAELTDPRISRTLNARLQGVTLQAVEVLSRKLEASDSAELALEALGITTKVKEDLNRGK